MANDITVDEPPQYVSHPGRTQRAGVLITLIAVVGAVALMDIIAEMVVDLVRLKAENDY